MEDSLVILRKEVVPPVICSSTSADPRALQVSKDEDLLGEAVLRARARVGW
jgi:hypothetical protein